MNKISCAILNYQNYLLSPWQMHQEENQFSIMIDHLFPIIDFRNFSLIRVLQLIVTAKWKNKARHILYIKPVVYFSCKIF